MSYLSYEYNGVRGVGEVDGESLIPLQDISEIGRSTTIETLASAERMTNHPLVLEEVRVLPVVTDPARVICVGLNYRDHIVETKRDFPTYPVMFPKFASSLIGAYDDIVVPPESSEVDYEGEMAVVIGRRGRRITEEDALDHVLGYTVANDITMLDFQYKTHQWMQGKAWDASTPLGPRIVCPAEVDLDSCGIRTIVNGEKVQESNLSQLLFTVPNLIATISTFTTLEPGDVILTGTPGGVGYRRKPQLLLKPGDHVSVEIDHLGAVSNRLVAGDG
ncbi:fumarylacetoacetate hydrolase family protein [Rhodococcus sp. BGS-1C]|jgi:acylpyruvate hydrolase|uniref:fumarylacetoacetate hydrolase family protein n=1 Tax=Nocardiaceae TaxID=85025 RepID=UPI0019D1A168|nr:MULTISPECIES: fumarylacetoacetate hydrolase family protein [Rhodococcus]MCZ4276668.1 fumarylacetoacetate hydrolase family protein [Rhodococcus yunnanensis]